MAASGFTPIQLYYSTTATNVPLAANLVAGELAINTADGKLYYKNVSGVVTLLAGLSGFSGASGFSGFSGFSGVSGSGVSGFSGISGFSGASGISGFSGANGTIGVNGASGFSGFSGYSGISGFSGANGTFGGSGASGFSGFSGSGISGYSGAGLSGFSGYSGYSGVVSYPTAGIVTSTGLAFGSVPDPLRVSNGGTGLTALTAGFIPFGNSATQLGSSSLLNWSTANVRLGVGIATPVATLHVRGGNSNNAIIDNDGSQFTTMSWYTNGSLRAQGYYDASNLLFVFGTDVAAPVIFKTNGTENMRLTSGGGVSIGTATSAGVGNLLVNGSVTGTSYKTTNFTITESGGKLYFYYGATQIASMDSSGNLITLGSNTAGGTP